MDNASYNFIICGAGPVGLAAAIRAGQLGAKVLVIEKSSTASTEPRGESMAHWPLLDLLLGENWLQQNSLVDPAYRRFHSPLDKKDRLIDVHNAYYFFEWHTLISHMEQRAKDAGCQFSYNTQLTESLVKDNRSVGVKCIQQGKELIYYGNSVLNATGHGDPFKEQYNLSREAIDCPTIKYLSKQAPGVDVSKEAIPQFFLLPPKSLDYAPHLPAAVAYVFPLGNHRMEAGLMLRLGTLHRLKDASIPDEKEMFIIWEQLKKDYPGFSEYFKGATPDYEKLTVISNRELVENIIPHPRGGMVLLGDITGFSDANGSSGLYYGMAQACFWVDRIIQEKQDLWSPAFIQKSLKDYRKWDIYRYIKKSYKDIKLAEKLMFLRFGSIKGLNRFWGLFMTLLQMKTKR
ncbi:MAG: FAD-dependent oxidoreductase [Spirochaetaceae bacterium]|jgi:flavin-dependent dehydrogenase|nr:FAD-dependent oxidoreductase [Spirochaetaceae bacterium]